MIIPDECAPFRRCKRWRYCQHCNNIRKAQHADIAEMAARFSDNASYTVIMPFNQGQEMLKNIRTKIVRGIRGHRDGAMVSIESSKNDALHLNIIATHKSHTPKDFYTQTMRSFGIESSIFTKPLQSPADIRNVVSYSLKFESIPNVDQWGGKIATRTGTFRKMADLLVSKKMINMNPEITLIVLNERLKNIGLRALTPKSYSILSKKNMVKTLEHYANQISTMGDYINSRGQRCNVQILQKHIHAL